METYQADKIKNIVILGNAGSGKTTLSEAILFNGGIIERKGQVEKKNTVSDYKRVEQENTSSVFPSVLYSIYNDNKINIIDVPGLDDFVGGMISGLNPAETGIMLINAQNGVEVGTEIQFRHSETLNKPLIFTVNLLDHEKSNFEKTIESLKERFGNNVVLTQFPVNEGSEFNSFIDVIKMKMYKYPNDGGKPEITDIPSDHLAHAEDLQNELIEKAAENDEGLMEIFFEKETLDENEMRAGIKEGLIQRGIFPVFCISAKKDIGIERLMEFIVNAVPGPTDIPSPVNSEGNEIKCDLDGPASLFVFKSAIEEHIGEVNFFKVMSGKISVGMDLINTTTQNKERITQIYVMAGKDKEKVSEMVAGDIGATVKLKETRTNHTLNIAGQNWKFNKIDFPEPKYRTAIKPISEGDEEKLGEALQRMHEEDPTILIEYSKELKQIIVFGQGEHHLNILKWHLDNIFNVNTEFLPPRIPYRETITKSAQADYRHKKQSGGAGQFGEVYMVIEPYKEGMNDPKIYKINGREIKVSVRKKDEYDLEWGGKLVFYNCIVGGAIDIRFLPAILKGVMEKMEEGPLTGSYARDICVAVYDGKMHPVDSNEISFKLAGRNAFKNAFKNAGPKIMEPVYKVDILVPSDRMGDVVSDLQGRRGMILGMSSEKDFEKISTKVPLAEMNKYSTALSSLTNGRAMYTMKFLEYTQVPGDLQEELIRKFEEEQEED
ncbi:MAG: elongation factor G [Bacteroidetes bacterium]|nr:elongation factor G [Bacteroidota bacterium]